MDTNEFADKMEHLIGAYRVGALTEEEFLDFVVNIKVPQIRERLEARKRAEKAKEYFPLG